MKKPSQRTDQLSSTKRLKKEVWVVCATIRLQWARNADRLSSDAQRNIPTLTLRNVGIFILTTPLDLSRKKFLDSRCIQKETFSSPFDRTPTEKSLVVCATIRLQWARNADRLSSDAQRNIRILTLSNMRIFILTTPLDLSRKKFLDVALHSKGDFFVSF